MSTACPICTTESVSFATHRAHGEQWTAFHCARCESQYWHPRELRPDYYAEAHHGTYDRRRSGEAFLRARHTMFLSRAQPGHLLDIGCGEGAFLAEAQRRGFEVAGLDLDPGNVETTRSRGIPNALCTTLLTDDGEMAPEVAALAPFDAITAFEVLEHQVDPLAFLRGAAGALRPGGTFSGSVPNRDRLLAARKRQQGEGDWPPHHFFWFSRSSLEATLRAAGFTNVRVLPVPEDDLWSQAASFESALLGRLRRPRGSSARRGGATPARKSLVKRAARYAKDVPFLPLALAVKHVVPERGRQLYFEAQL